MADAGGFSAGQAVARRSFSEPGGGTRGAELVPGVGSAVTPAQAEFDRGDFGFGGGLGGGGERRPLVQPGELITFTALIDNRSTVTGTATLTATTPVATQLVTYTPTLIVYGGGPAQMIDYPPGSTCRVLPPTDALSGPRVVCRIPGVAPNGSAVISVVVRVQACSVNPLVNRIVITPTSNPQFATTEEVVWCNDSYTLPWYDYNYLNGLDQIVIGNPNPTPVQVTVSIAGQARGGFTVPANGQIAPTFPGVWGGPVVVKSLSGARLVVSNRVESFGTVNEVLGATVADFGETIVFPWYDSRATNGRAWVIIGNPYVTGTLGVQVRIAGNDVGSFQIAPASVITPTFANVVGGPVEITSLSGADIYALQRVAYGTSLSHLIGIPREQATNEWYLPRYDAARLDAQALVIAYPVPIPQEPTPGSRPIPPEAFATVEVRVASAVRQQVQVPLGRSVPVSLAGVTGGPVEVVATNGVGLIVTKRSVYRGSLSETPLATDAQTSEPTTASAQVLYLPTYNNATPGRSSTIDIAVPTDADGPASVDVFIGGVRRTTVTVPVGGTVPVTLPGVAGGPVRLAGSGRFVASVRAFYATGYDEQIARPLE